jgi:uncharacterized protein
LLSMGYLGAIAVLVQRKPALVGWMSYPGRTSLTNYLLQSVFLSMIFGAWGLGLFQAVDYWVALLIGVTIYLVLAGLSILWLRKFSQGPMEQLMGMLTRRRRGSPDGA